MAGQSLSFSETTLTGSPCFASNGLAVNYRHGFLSFLAVLSKPAFLPRSLPVNLASAFPRSLRSFWRNGLFLVCVAISARASPAEVQSLLAAGEAAEARFDVRAALHCFREADVLQPNDRFILQKISKQLSDGLEDITDVKERTKQSQEALSYSRRALELSPQDPVCLLSMAVCYGKLTATADNATKVEYSRLVKRYADEALAANPNYDWAHHLLGRWNYEVSLIGGPTRVAARLLYGGLPAASCKEAILHLEKAVELNPKIPSHHVELGYAYLASGDKARATAEWKKGLELPSLEKHDETSKARARASLERFK